MGARSRYVSLIGEAIAGCHTALDVGCGVNSPLLDVEPPPPGGITGVDGHAPTVDACRTSGRYATCERLDILSLTDRFDEDAFDAVVALDVIEHLEKADGPRFLEQLEAVARRTVVVSTPNGFLPQGALHGNPAQVHRSGWTTSEFEARGYQVHGAMGWKPLRGERALPTVKPAPLGSVLSVATQPLVTRRPERAFQLVAYRHLHR